MSTVIIGDIIGSRELADRTQAQRLIDGAVAKVEADAPGAERVLTPTVGDEVQGVYRSLAEALSALTLLRLALPDEVDLRFGVGVGPIGVVPSTAGGIAEGPGWWAARRAIDTLHAKQVRALPRARTWVAAADGAMDPLAVELANAYVWSRDELISSMSERTRRLAYGRCLGSTQAELAAQEGITQSGVSQALTTAGAAAVVEAFKQLRTLS
jgi:hypothetical protein